MIAFGNHCTTKHPFGFRWFSPSGTKRHDCHDVSHPTLCGPGKAAILPCKTGLDVGDWFETGFALGKAGTVMIAFGNHYTIKHPFGFRWFSPSGEMPPLLLGGKAGTVMIAFGNHYTTNPQERQNRRSFQSQGNLFAWQRGGNVVSYS